MPRLLLSSLVYAATCLQAASVCFAAGALDTKDFADVAAAVDEAVTRYGADKVALVCDIDNTLLAMRGDLGSDQWFEWQAYLLKHEPESKQLVAKDFDGLLAAQGLLFTLGHMRPTQPDLPEKVAAIQAQGVRTLVLTSRGDEYRDATERELLANGYDFRSTRLPIEDPPCGLYQPYDLDDIESSGLTAEEARLFRLEEARDASFGAGVMMTAGQHKGAMLLSMLHKCPEKFEAVVFVDDHGRHVVRVYDALARRGIDVTAFHYKREDANVKRFEYSDKAKVTRQWRQLDKTLGAVFN
ncbi:MAG: DUF2608 domain-containing protein [Planctomycetota bacterium]